MAERKAYANLILFVQRCIDIIEFIKAISRNDTFLKILLKVKKNEILLTGISNMTYKHLVMLQREEDKNLMKELYE